MTDEPEPHIEVDLGSETSSEDGPAPAKPLAKPWTCNQILGFSFLVIWTLAGLLFLALSTYYQVAECAKYPDYTNVWCNTTSFRTVNTSFSGVTGLVKADYLNGGCHSPEFQAFACIDLQNLQNCVTAGQLNFGTKGVLWPCFLEDPATACAASSPPLLEPPNKSRLPGCVKQTAFCITGSVMIGLVLLWLWLKRVIKS
jgi:hypothetical protein